MNADLENIAHRVNFLLLHSLECRDDDRLLLSLMWQFELQDGEDFFNNLENGRLSNAETITRIRRKLQEKFPNLRGTKWDSRHNLEAAVCQQLTFFDNWS